MNFLKQFRKQEVEKKFKDHFWDEVGVVIILIVIFAYNICAVYGIISIIRNFII